MKEHCDYCDEQECYICKPEFDKIRDAIKECEATHNNNSANICANCGYPENNIIHKDHILSQFHKFKESEKGVKNGI